LANGSLRDMDSWYERLGHTKLRTFTETEGRIWIEQNSQKSSKWAKLARAGHRVAWEVEKAGGAYTGRVLIDGEVYSASEATKKFLKVGEEERKRKL
jgi:hypothetical protein